MTGPEHYREAERLMVEVASQQRVAAGMERDPKVFAHHWRQAEHSVALAQVHATLALAAAQAPVVNTMQEQEILGRSWNAAVSQEVVA